MVAFCAMFALSGWGKTMSRMQPYDKGINLIPLPQDIVMGTGVFVITDGTALVADGAEARSVADFYAEKLRRSTGYKFSVSVVGKRSGSITLRLSKDMGISTEGYRLDVTRTGVDVVAATAQGLFYGMATLMQLLPAEVESQSKVSGAIWKVPCVSIADSPRFAYRGLMIDVARHFTSVEGLKKHIDMLGTLKINHLHLHLSDYQGWRVEIKRYPLLTQVGAKRIDEYGHEYSGYYTQDEIRELVRYASERYVTIVPEIDVPGHSLAAIAAYPELSCTGDRYQVMSRWGGFPVVLCPGKEKMFEMLDGIFAELSGLFPGEYFHIGGDECPKDVWKTCQNCQRRIAQLGLKADSGHTAEQRLQSYAIGRCEKILAKYGKKMIGWDEILEGGLAPDATVMSWRGEQGGIKSALMGHNVIMTPTSGGMYLDYYQCDSQVEPFAWGGYAPISKTYAYDPVPDTLRAMGKDKYVWGVQANAWSECMYTEDLVEYRVYPRILAVAEVGWTDAGKKDFGDFCRRLANAYVRMDCHGINYYMPLPEQPGRSMNHVAFLDTVSVAFGAAAPVEKMVYTLDGSEPDESSDVYANPLRFDASGVIKIRSVLPSGKMSDVRTVNVERQTMLEARQVMPKDIGLSLRMADARCLTLKEMDAQTTWKDSVVARVEDMARLRPNKFANVEFYVADGIGYINVKEEGIYEFRSDYTQVLVDGVVAVDNEGQPQVNSKGGRSLALRKGWHQCQVRQISNFIGGWNSQHRNSGAVSLRKYGEKEWCRAVFFR